MHVCPLPQEAAADAAEADCAEGPATKKHKSWQASLWRSLKAAISHVETLQCVRRGKFCEALALRSMPGAESAAGHEIVAALQGIWHRVGVIQGSPIYRQEPTDELAPNDMQLFMIYIANDVNKWMVTAQLDVEAILKYTDGMVYAQGDGDSKSYPSALCKVRRGAKAHRTAHPNASFYLYLRA